MIRCLFGPAPATFRAKDLGLSADAVLFDFDGKQPLNLATKNSWQDVQAVLPIGWRPDLLVLSLSYKTIPLGLWGCPAPILGLAHDWNLVWSAYRHVLPRCDAIFTDLPGVDRLRRAGFSHVYPVNLYGLEADFLAATPGGERERDIDVLFVGNCHPAVQRERLAWLGRIGRLANHRHIVVRERTYGPEYRELLGRAKIVFNRSLRGECNHRVFEAIAGGALLLQERENAEVPLLLHPGTEFADYDSHDLEAVIEHYLTHEAERLAIVEKARGRLHEFTFAAFWEKAMSALQPAWDDLRERAVRRAGKKMSPSIQAGAWMAALGGTLIELSAALKESPMSAAKANAAGVFAPGPAEAADCFFQALALEPNHLLAGLNKAEALFRAGKKQDAADQAHRTLALLERIDCLDGAALDAPHYPPGFDLLGVEWERAGWQNAGNPDQEREDKRALLRFWLHSVLGDLTGNLNHFKAAALARPDLPSAQAAYGCALARAGQMNEARPLLLDAITANPFDVAAARALHQVLNEMRDWAGLAALANERLDLHKAAPGLVPLEEWFRTPPLSGNERTSIIVLGCNEVAFTRLCLESVLRHTHGDYELILVDNGSTDETPRLFEEVRACSGPGRVELIRNENNRGFAAAVNQALAVAQGQFIVLLNNDTVVTPEWLEGLIYWSLYDWPHVGLVGPMTNYTAAPQRIEPGYRELSDLDAFSRQHRQLFAGQALDVPRLTGFCLLVRRDVLDRLGGRLAARYGQGFFEDDDLCYHARQLGFKLLMAKNVYVHHFGSRTFAGLGIDTEARLRENLQRFRDKWGHEAARPYRAIELEPVEPIFRAATARPKVSLCMIVKNEEANLADCLAPLRDVVDEIVIVDTGSDDRTKEIAHSLGARVIESSWQDSFSAARNESIQHARGEWIFWMDADDRIDPANLLKLKKLFATLGEENRAYVMKCLCVASAPGETATVVDHVRLFRNDPRLRWTYRVHEQILPAIRAINGEPVWTDIVIQHTGYTDPVFRRKKLERDLRLLQIEQRERPDDAFILFNLGSVLRELNRPAEALDLLQRSLQRSHPNDSIVRKLYSMIAQCKQQLGSLDDALAICAEGRALYPRDAELLFVESALLSDKRDWSQAEDRLKKLIGETDEEHFASVVIGLRGYKARHNLALLYFQQKRYAEAEDQWESALVEEPAFLPAQIGMGETLIQSRQWDKLEKHVDALNRQGPRGEEEADGLLVRGMLERQEFATARIYIRRAIERFPQSVNLRVLLTHALLKERTDDDAAEEALKAVLALDPNHSEARSNLVALRALRTQVNGMTRAPKVFVLCPDHNVPSGGVRRLYRHVDVLNSHGFQAAILHQKAGFRCTWFENRTCVFAHSQVAATASDFLVVPEILAASFANLAPGIPKVIFNQNAYFTFRGWLSHGLNGACPYRDADLAATLVVSQDNLEYMNYAFPGLPVHRLHYGIDLSFSPRWPKQRKIAYMPRKNAEDALQVINILRHRGALNGWELEAIDGLPEHEVAERLGSVAVFLSFGNPEGFSLPPLEAMACGCVVIGYHGRGGREYFDPSFSYPIEAGDIIGFARVVEDVLRREQAEPGTLERQGKQAVEFVRANYSPERESQEIVEIWRTILGARQQAIQVGQF
jgi:glycosyltransferase involved in cell wall biosynthesis